MDRGALHTHTHTHTHTCTKKVVNVKKIRDIIYNDLSTLINKWPTFQLVVRLHTPQLKGFKAIHMHVHVHVIHVHGIHSIQIASLCLHVLRHKMSADTQKVSFKNLVYWQKEALTNSFSVTKCRL